jgi:hypothetical protein
MFAVAELLGTDEMTKIFVATPCYGGMCTGYYAQSLLMMQAAFSAKGIEAAVSMLFNESLITRARNAMAHAFLQTDSTHLLFIDSDLRWDGNGVIAMIEADKEVICGIYPKKEINWHTVAQAAKTIENPKDLASHTASWVINLVDYAGSVEVPVDKPFEIWAGGTGMMLIKREVFEKLMDVTPQYSNDMVDLNDGIKDRELIYNFFDTSIEPGTNRLLSEDYHFCRQWRLLEGKIWCAPWMTAAHIGTYVFEGKLSGPTAPPSVSP